MSKQFSKLCSMASASDSRFLPGVSALTSLDDRLKSVRWKETFLLVLLWLWCFVTAEGTVGQIGIFTERENNTVRFRESVMRTGRQRTVTVSGKDSQQPQELGQADVFPYSLGRTIPPHLELRLPPATREHLFLWLKVWIWGTGSHALAVTSWLLWTWWL